MFSTTRPTALLPHEINLIDQIFEDILLERGIPRDCETAEEIARRLIVCYQLGIRESGAMKYEIGFSSISSPARSEVHPA